MHQRLSTLALAACALALPLASQAQTEIQWWHSMTAVNGDWVNDLAKEFNASQKDYKIVPTFKGTYDESLAAGIAAFRAGNAPAVLQVYEVGTATMMASKGAIDASRHSGLPVFIEVQRLQGRMVSEVRQVIGISIATRDQATLLRCKTREPLLRIQRWYYDSQHTLLEVTDSLHPQDRFQYAVTLRHVSGAGITQSPSNQE